MSAPEFSFEAVEPARRRLSLTPMIDVVFLLLVFFMLAARYGVEEATPLPLAGAGTSATAGAPRIIDVRPDGVALNGQTMAEAALPAAVLELAPTMDALVALRGRDGATVQRLIDIAEALSAAGLTRIAVAE